MTGVTVDDKAFQLDFKRAMAELEIEGKKDVRSRADRILGRAKGLVHVLSGETRDSGEVVENEDGSCDVRFSAPQAIDEEFGTHDMGPIPFLRPAVAEEK